MPSGMSAGKAVPLGWFVHSVDKDAVHKAAVKLARCGNHVAVHAHQMGVECNTRCVVYSHHSLVGTDGSLRTS